MIKEFTTFDESNDKLELLNLGLFTHFITPKYLDGFSNEIDNLENILVEEKKWIKNIDFDLLNCVVTNSNQLLNIIRTLQNGEFPEANMRKRREIIKIKSTIENNIIINITKLNQRNSR
jgi:hypothetical protein